MGGLEGVAGDNGAPECPITGAGARLKSVQIGANRGLFLLPSRANLIEAVGRAAPGLPNT